MDVPEMDKVTVQFPARIGKRNFFSPWNENELYLIWNFTAEHDGMEPFSGRTEILTRLLFWSKALHFELI